MPYVLQVWQQPDRWPLPDDLGGAMNLVDNLRAAPAPPASVLPTLAQRLTARYPCLRSPRAVGMSEAHLAWTEAPLDGKSASPIYTLNLNPAMLDQVLPFVVRTALALGLNVVDPQAGRYYLSDYRVLSAAGTPSETPTWMDKKAMMARVRAQLDPLLATRGFKHDPSAAWSAKGCMLAQYRNEFRRGWHKLSVWVDEEDTHHTFSIDVSTQIDKLSEVAFAFWQENAAVPWSLSDEVKMMHQKAWLEEPAPGVELDEERAYVVRSLGDLDRALEDVSAQMQRRLFPITQIFTSIKGANMVLNPTPVSRSFYFQNYEYCTAHVLAAYFSKDPGLERLCEELMAQTRDLDSYKVRDIPLQLHRCIAYVRSNPFK